MSDKNKVKIVFMGTPSFSVPVLEGLLELEGFEVVGVVTQPDKPAGRGNEVVKSPVKKLAEEKKISVLQPAKITPEVVVEIGKLKPDVIVVAAYGKIIPKSLLDLPKFKCINVHGSLLPKYRGASPIQWAILEGEKETGISIMIMDEKMDTGPVLEMAKIDIAEDETTGSLFNKMAELSKEVIKDVLPRWIKGELKSKAQNDKKATYTKILSKDDGHIFWNKTAVEIERQVRAFDPWPGCFAMYEEGGERRRLKVLEARVVETNAKSLHSPKGTMETTDICHAEIDSASRAGLSLRGGYCRRGNPEILKQVQDDIQDDKSFGKIILTDKKELGVITSDGLLILEIVQPEGKKKMTAKEFLNGHQKIVNSILK